MNKKFFSFLVIVGLVVLVLFFIREKAGFNLDFMSWIANSIIAQIIVAIGIGFVVIILIKAFLNFLKTNFRR
ncbi:MAG: hypothetical protein AABW47_00200 [Nanoarchaeota archaeon]